MIELKQLETLGASNRTIFFFKTNVNNSCSIEEFINIIIDKKEYSSLSFVFTSFKIPVDVIEKLSESKSDYIRSYVARHTMSKKTLINLAFNASDYIKNAILDNKACPKLLREEILDSPAYKKNLLGRMIMSNSTSTGEIIHEALEHYKGDIEVNTTAFMESIARHRNTTPIDLYKLSECRLRGVQDAVAKNPNTPQEALDVLSRSLYYDEVVCSALENKNTSDKTKIKGITNKAVSLSTLELLCSDKSRSVRNLAKKTLKLKQKGKK